VMAVRPSRHQASGCQQWLSSLGLCGREVLSGESYISTTKFRCGSTLTMGNTPGVGKGMLLAKVLEN